MEIHKYVIYTSFDKLKINNIKPSNGTSKSIYGTRE